MAKTFEALQKAEKEHQIRPEEAKIFDLRPPAKSLPLSYKLPPQVAEEYQRMKHLILNANPEKKIKTILFVCFNVTLVNYIKRLLSARGLPLGKNGIHVIHFYQLWIG